jgi:membrane-bound metal-dependent hydrolase YbcI (DUF457 family)
VLVATPIGHLLAGAAIGTLMSQRGNLPRAILIGGLAAIAADFDFIPGILMGNPGRFHHAQSHSVMFAVLAGVVAGLTARKARFHWASLVGFGYASHILLDFLTFDDSVPQGIPIFWPLLSDVFNSPVTFFLNAPWGSGLVLNAHNFELLVREVGILGLFFVAALLYARPRLRSLKEV